MDRDNPLTETVAVPRAGIVDTRSSLLSTKYSSGQSCFCTIFSHHWLQLSSSVLDSKLSLVSFAPYNHLRQYAIIRSSRINDENQDNRSLAMTEVTEII